MATTSNPISAEALPTSPALAAAEIQTYHCICTTVLVATTHTISKLPRRATPPSLDGAYMLPISALASTSGRGRGSADEDEDQDQDQDDDEPGIRNPGKWGTTLLLPALTRNEKQPVVVRRADGFEVRVLLRCARCAVVVGYVLVGAGGLGLQGLGIGIGIEKGKGKGKGKASGGGGDDEDEEAEVEEVVYLLPGALLASDDLRDRVKPEVPPWEAAED